MPVIRRALAAAAFAALAACASVPRAPGELDLAAKRFGAPAPGQATLYVYRNEVFGGLFRMSLELDGAFLGDTAPLTFHWVTIAPGRHTLVGRAENTSVVEFIAGPGQNVFVWQEVKMGLASPRNQLRLVDENAGRVGVSECTLAASPAPAAAAKPATPPGASRTDI